MIVVGIAAAATASWAVSPFVAMHRRGTIVERQRAIMRAEVAHLAAQRAETGRSVGHTIAPVVIPAPRAAVESAGAPERIAS